MSATVRKIALSQPETSTLARNLIKAAATQGRILSYAQALSETASLLGYANVHEMTAATKAKVAASKPTGKTRATPTEDPILTAAQQVIYELENAVVTLISEITDHIPADGYEALIAAATFRHEQLGHPLDSSIAAWREAAAISREEDEADEDDDGPLVTTDVCADGYIIRIFSSDDDVPAEVREQGNNPAYPGCALERLKPGHPDAIPFRTLQEMARRDVADICKRRGWNAKEAESITLHPELALDGTQAGEAAGGSDAPSPVRFEIEAKETLFIALGADRKDGVQIKADWDQVIAAYLDEDGNEDRVTWATFAEAARSPDWGVLSGPVAPVNRTTVLGAASVEVVAANVKTTVSLTGKTLSVEQISTETDEEIGSFKIPV